MSVRKNLIANYVGQGWSAVIGIVFVPVYIRYLGIEAYGIIGFFAAIQSLLALLDLGASATLNRELARHSASGSLAEARQTVRTLEWMCWPTAALGAFIVWILSDIAAEHWLSTDSIEPSRAARALALLGIAMALQWSASFYSGGLAGLQRQVMVNVTLAVLATIRAVGSIVVLAMISPTIEAFLWWQIAVSAAQSVVFFFALWRAFPAALPRPTFSPTVVRRVARFALGITGVGIVSFLLTSSDRIVLSKVLTLHDFGVYAFAATTASTLFRLVQPVITAVYPRYSQLVVVDDTKALKDFYHRSNQFVAVVVLPVAAVGATFAEDILLLWTRDPALATAAASILSLLLLGAALNALMNLPYMLQLAYGWTSLSFYINVGAVFVLVPGVWLLGNRYGGLGAALLWPLLNLGYLLVQIPLMHRRIMRGEMWAWYLRDVGPVCLAALVLTVGWRLLFPQVLEGFHGAAILLVIGATTAGTCALVSPLMRTRLLALARGA
jgi:O-antigen/teichoic acid export membrane protein